MTRTNCAVIFSLCFLIAIQAQCNHYSTTSACAALNVIPPLPNCGNYSGRISNETAFFVIVGDFGLSGIFFLD